MKRSIMIPSLLFLVGMLFFLFSEGCNFQSNSWPPKPKLGTGTVIGKVNYPSTAGFHFTSKDLFLGKLIYSNQSNMDPIISFTYGVDPGTKINRSDGTFAFTDVAPGPYILIFWTPENSKVMKSPEGDLINVAVEMDKITDLGSVVFP